MNTASLPRRAYSYLRMSTQQQLRGDSLRRQLEKSREYAARHGLELVEEDELKDIGKSAFKGQHLSEGVLGLFLQRIENGEIPKGSFLLVENLDRLSRDKPLQAAELLQSICRRGITVVTLIDGQEYTDLNDNHMQLLMSVLTFQRAHEESKTKQKRLQESWKSRRANSHETKVTSVAPKWLDPVKGKNKRTHDFKPVPERVAVVRRIFKDSAAGLGAFTIARRLNSEGISTFGRSTGWQPSYIKKILGSKAVLGEYQPHHFVEGERKPLGPPLPDYYPRIVSDEMFAAANIAIQSRHPTRRGGGRTGENYANLFKGLLFCAHCGSTMRLLNKGPPPKGGRYLVCEAGYRGMSCNKKAWRYDSFERAFFHHAELDLGIRSAAMANEKMLPTLDAKIAAAKEHLAGLQRQAAIMDESFRRMTKGPTDNTLDRRAELEDDVAAAQAALDALAEEYEERLLPRAVEHSLTNYDEMYDPGDHTDFERKRALAAQQIRQIVKRIDISTDGLGCYFTDRWRDRLDGSTEEAEDYGLFDPADQMGEAPAFSIQFNAWLGGHIVQPNPFRLETRRFRCGIRPENHRELDPSEYRVAVALNGDELTYLEMPALYTYWPPDEEEDWRL